MPNWTVTLQQTLLDDLRIGEHMLTSDMDLPTASALWLKNSFWKKFQDELLPTADAACLELFKESNRRCSNFQWKPRSIQDEEVIGEVKSLWYDIVWDGPDLALSLSDILDNFGVGPGANIGARDYNFYSKLFDSPLTGTSERLYRYYRYSIMTSPTFLSAEVSREKSYGHRIVAGNRLSFVPKTSEISRSICTEPTLNMLCQKGIGSVLEARLKRKFRIDLSKQPDLNRRMAREGSSNGSFGTIDLSSASDSISLLMLKEILPAELLSWLELSRSPCVVFPDNSVSELYMVSSMGNAFTFPLETLLFSTIVVACYRVLGIKPRYEHSGPSNFGVFGDDIIVRKDAYDFVCRTLELFGFTVNDQKSFNTGHFRESCGGDYFRGHDIRGVYCKSLLTSADIYSLINRLIRWSARSKVLLTQTISLLKRQVDFLPIPFHDGDAEGIKCPSAPIGLRRDRNGGIKYRALKKEPVSYRMPVSPDQRLVTRRGKSAHLIGYNPNGLLVSLLGGAIRNGRISVRSDRETFKVRNRVTSCWENWRGRSSLKDWIEIITSQQLSVDSVTRTAEPSGRNIAFSPEEEWELFFDLYN